MPPDPGVTEIRVHGVGGASPERILERSGYTQVTGDDTAGFFRTRADDGHNIEAYSWGGLTARSTSRALWVLLLPFSLVNLAGWMIEPTDDKRAVSADDKTAARQRGLLHWQEISIHVVAITLTTLYVMWIALLSVNLLAYQCAGQAACRQDRWWLEFLGRDFFADAPGRRIVLGSLIPLGLLALFVFLGRVSRDRYDVDLERRSSPAAGSVGELTVSDPSFWSQYAWQRKLARLHVAQTLAAFSAVLSWGSWQFAIEFDLGGREAWGWIPVLAAAVLGVITVTALYFAVTASGGAGRGGSGRLLMRMSIVLTVISLAIAAGLRATDEQLTGPAADLWGFGWAPFLLLGWVAVWLAVFSVVQLMRWFTARDERWHELSIVALGFVIVFWRYAIWLLVGIVLFAAFSLWRDVRADPEPSESSERSEGVGPNDGVARRVNARSNREDLPATMAIILIALALIPLRMWSAGQDAPWGVDWPRLTPSLAAIVVVIVLAQVLPHSPQPRWVDATAATVMLLIGFGLSGVSDDIAWAWMAALVAYVALSVRWLTRLDLPYFRWNGGAAVAAFSVIVVTGLMASVFLRFTDILDRAGDVAVRRPGGSVVIESVVLKSINVLGWFAIAFTIIGFAVIVGWLLTFLGHLLTEGRQAQRAEEDRLRRTDTDNRLDRYEITQLSRGVALWTSLSRAVRSADVPITLTSLTAALALAAGVFALVESGVPARAWLDEPLPPEWSPLVTISSLIGLGIVIGGYLLVRSGLRSRTARQRIGVAWDVASFWPRRFHPLAPPAYAARGVPELRARIIEATDSAGRVVLSCHSQGTVMGLVAVASLPPENARRTALITHGSPLSSFYQPFFPRFFTEELLRDTAKRLGVTPEPDDGGWINFYRDTDPIGHAVFTRTGEPQPLPRQIALGLAGRWGPTLPDVRLDDPWQTELLPLQPPPQLLVHSSYANDPIMAKAIGAAVEGFGEHARGDEQVVLVDGDDAEKGTTTRLAAHSGFGRLHRAFSVFIFDEQGRLLLQKRAASKPIFGGLWANTCCSHPGPGESILEAANRRLGEEMGLTAELTEVGWFEYRAEDPESGYVEHELDHVLVGTTNRDPTPESSEVDGWEWADFAAVKERAAAGDGSLAPWVKEAIAALPDLGPGRRDP